MTVTGSREDLVDEVYILRNRVRGLTVENEKLQRELAQAVARIEDLEAQLDSHREQEEEPYV